MINNNNNSLLDTLKEICEVYGYTTYTKNILNPITIEELLEASVKGSIIKNLITKYSKQKISNAIKHTFYDRDHTKNTSIPKFLLSKAQLSHCKSCGLVKPYEDYYISTTGSLASQCKDCSKESRKISYIKNPGKELVANYKRKRRLQEFQTPTWADKEAIELFYKNRPDGYHVDHIIPLNATLACGLHVLENLQYLTKEENLRKKNSYIP